MSPAALRSRWRREGIVLAWVVLLAASGCQTSAGTALHTKSAPSRVAGGRAPSPAHEARSSGRTDIAIGASTDGFAGAALERVLGREAQAIDRIADAVVERRGVRLIVLFPSGFFSGGNSAALSPEAQDRLRRLAKTLGRYPDSRILVKGYADAGAEGSASLRLSDRRAQNVRGFLVSHGVDADRLTAIGLGVPPATTDAATAGRRLPTEPVALEIIPNESVRDTGGEVSGSGGR